MLKSGTSVCINVIRKNSTSTNWLLTSSFIIIKHLKTRQQIHYLYWLDTWCCVSRCCVSRFTFSWHKSLGFTKQPLCHRDTQTQKVQDEFVVNMQTLQQSMSAHLSAHPLVVRKHPICLHFTQNKIPFWYILSVSVYPWTLLLLSSQSVHVVHFDILNFCFDCLRFVKAQHRYSASSSISLKVYSF